MLFALIVVNVADLQAARSGSDDALAARLAAGLLLVAHDLLERAHRARIGHRDDAEGHEEGEQAAVEAEIGVAGRTGARGRPEHVLAVDQAEHEDGRRDERGDEPHYGDLAVHELARLVAAVPERELDGEEAVHGHYAHVPNGARAKENVGSNLVTFFF